MKIGIDLMGSDLSPHVLLKELEKSLITSSLFFSKNITFIFFISEDFKKILLEHSLLSKNTIIVSKDEITPEDTLYTAMRKKESSIAYAVQAIKDKTIDGLVTTCQTAALTSFISLNLQLYGGVERPPLIAALPTIKTPVTVLDVGATINSSAKQLVHFAKLGMAYHSSLYCHENPVLGLLNIGEEAHKGKGILKEAFHLLQSQYPNFIGNIQGREIFRGVADVVITEGFTGNVFLKTAEGVASFILESLEDLFKLSPQKIERNLLEKARKQFDYKEYPGAFFAGIDGVIIKCHGNASGPAFFNCIRGAKDLIENRVVERIMSCI